MPVMDVGPCDICGDPSVPVEPHSEDYSQPYRWDRPAEYPLCRTCHRDRLHKRFAKPDMWEAHKAHVRRGGYASDLKDPDIAAEVKAYRVAFQRGERLVLRQLRPRRSTSGKWWEELSVDPAILTSPDARPRP
ncbi:MAG TPA: hypothetical protein VIJ37_07025 [Steroidobacteraceae bacterium]